MKRFISKMDETFRSTMFCSMNNIRRNLIYNSFICLIIIILSITSFTTVAQGYQIKTKINGLNDTTIILGHYFANNQMIPVDTIKLDSNGEGVFEGANALPGGMYLIYLPSKRRFDILISDDQYFSIENDTVNFYENMKSEGSIEIEALYKFNRLMMADYKNAQEIMQEKKTVGQDEKKLKKLNDKLIELRNQKDKNTQKFINDYSNTLFSKFIKSTINVPLPNSYKDKDGRFIDSLYFQYRQYIRDHFFDNFDFADHRLLRTPIYEKKIDEYLEILPVNIDTINTKIDYLIEKSKTDDKLYRYMLTHIFIHYASHKMVIMENVFVHLAEKYILSGQAQWYNKKAIENLKSIVKRKKCSAPGKTASPLSIASLPSDTNAINDIILKLKKLKEETQKLAEDKSKVKLMLEVEYQNLFDVFYNENFKTTVDIHSIEANHMILWFWEPGCSHCKVATPVLGNIYDKHKANGCSVYATFIAPSPFVLSRSDYNKEDFIDDWKEFLRETDKWLKFIKKKNLVKWINLWDPYNYSDFRTLFDVMNTPVSFLLDSKKEILTKNANIEEYNRILIGLNTEDIYRSYSGEERTRKMIEYLNSFDQKEDLEILKEIVSRVFNFSEAVNKVVDKKLLGVD